MAEFLYGEALGQKIREVVHGAELRCAVAFWGGDAVSNLFGTDALEREDVWIVCDISMGNTNPTTLRKMIKHYPKNHGHVLGLHAKVYHSNAGMVVGSANASHNGIGFGGQAARHLETGIHHGSEAACWEAAREWFDKLWENSIALNETAITSADRTWRTNQSIRHKIGRTALQIALIEVGKLSENLRIVLCYGEFDATQENDFRAAAGSVGLNPDANDFEALDSEGFLHDDWPEAFICLDLKGANVSPTFHRKGITENGWHFPDTISWDEFLHELGHPNAAIPAPITTRIRRQSVYKELADKNQFFTVDDILPLLE